MRERLIGSEECYRLLFERHPQPMAIYDSSSLRFLDVNDATVALYGYSRDEFLQMTVGDLLLWPAGGADSETGAEAPEAPGERATIRRHARRDRTPIDVAISSRELPLPDMPSPVRLLIIRDQTDRMRVETERRILEAQFRHTQKLEPVRRLAGGIAHDFNNLLTILLGYAEWLETREGLDPRFAEAAREIHHASVSASLLVRHLVAFSRQQAVRPRIVNLNAALADMHQVLRRVIGEDVALRTIPGAKEATIKIDPGQLEQIVLNLAVNARDAMPDGGALTFETQNIIHDDGVFVRLTVRDSGAGMAPEVRARVFEPFFTTKPAGYGAGLGLSAIYGIVSQHRGTISVNSEEGTGTCFEIDLPYAPAAASALEEGRLEVARAGTANDVDETPPLLRTAGGDEWILVVEDDARLRSLAEQILATRGYNVVSAGHGREAIAQIEKHRAKLSMLLTDVVLPDTNGRELANRALKVCPSLSVIYMSGYTDEGAIHCGGDTPQAFLSKPFTAVGLLELVRATLDAGRARGKAGGS